MTTSTLRAWGTQGLSRIWHSAFKPLLKRPPRLQVAALCYRGTGDARRVLLVTSRDTGRWIIPKGWPIDGKSAPAAAMQEAWEEAGVRKGTTAPEAIGSYRYNKRLKHGMAVPVQTLVFPVAVEELRDAFPEAGERIRKWVRPAEAQTMVAEPELKQLLGKMAS